MKYWRDFASYPFQSHDLWFLTEDIRYMQKGDPPRARRNRHGAWPARRYARDRCRLRDAAGTAVRTRHHRGHRGAPRLCGARRSGADHDRTGAGTMRRTLSAPGRREPGGHTASGFLAPLSAAPCPVQPCKPRASQVVQTSRSFHTILASKSEGKRMEFGVFDHVDRSALPLADFYDARLRIVEAYDRGGFYAYHVAEHHATPLGIAASPSVYL